VDGTVPGRFDVGEEQGTGVEEEQGANVEVHARTRRRVCGGDERGGGAGTDGCVAGK
jgi:hypothetical protein